MCIQLGGECDDAVVAALSNQTRDVGAIEDHSCVMPNLPSLPCFLSVVKKKHESLKCDLPSSFVQHCEYLKCPADQLRIYSALKCLLGC